VPVANKPILFYGLEAIAAAGIIEVGIIVGDTERDIREAVGGGGDFGLKVSYIRQEAPLGLAHAVRIARDFLADDDFVMYLGDNVVFDGITDLVDEFRAKRPDAQVMLTKVSDPSSFGVAVFDEYGKISSLEEKPENPASDLAVAGVYIFTPAVHDAVQAITPSRRGELEISDAISWLINEGRDVRSMMITGYWKDTGNITDMLEVNCTLLERQESCIEGYVDDASEIIGRVRIDAGAVVRSSRLVGPVAIGSGTVVEGSYIGPSTSIAENCSIRDSEIEFSIILRDSTFRGIRRIEASLIGRNVQITLASRVPATHRMVIGDHGRVQLSP